MKRFLLAVLTLLSFGELANANRLNTLFLTSSVSSQSLTGRDNTTLNISMNNANAIGLTGIPISLFFPVNEKLL